MRIVIRQQAPSIGDKYKIFIDDSLAYRAHSPIFRWSHTVIIQPDGGDQILVTITKKFNWLRPRYSIAIHHEVFEWYTESLTHGVYRCAAGSDLYEIISHKGHKHSVMKNFTQIGWWDKNVVMLMENDHYKIEVDADADHLLVISFCLIVDMMNDRTSGGLLFDFGNIGWGARPFDEQWQPKKKDEFI
jgi:uncharacterized protein YxjI